MLKKFWRVGSVLIGLVIGFCGSRESVASVGFGSRHMIMLSADMDHLWGSYYFAVKNQTDAPVIFRAPLSLPPNTVDFRAQEGLTDADIQLASNGSLFVEKEFPPGLNLLAVGFKLAHGHRDAMVTMRAAVDMDEFSILIPKSSGLSVEASALEPGVPAMLAGSQFVGLISPGAVAAESELQFLVKGIPEGRRWFWVVGLVVFILTVLGSVALSITSQPRTRYQET